MLKKIYLKTNKKKIDTMYGDGVYKDIMSKVMSKPYLDNIRETLKNENFQTPANDFMATEEALVSKAKRINKAYKELFTVAGVRFNFAYLNTTVIGNSFLEKIFGYFEVKGYCLTFKDENHQERVLYELNI